MAHLVCLGLIDASSVGHVITDFHPKLWCRSTPRTGDLALVAALLVTPALTSNVPLTCGAGVETPSASGALAHTVEHAKCPRGSIFFPPTTSLTAIHCGDGRSSLCSMRDHSALESRHHWGYHTDTHTLPNVCLESCLCFR